MPPNDRTRRAIDLLRQLMESAVRELSELDGLPLSQRAQRIVRALMARSFDAGLEYGKSLRDIDAEADTRPIPKPPPTA